MAEYLCATRTNYFHVTDEKKYQELLAWVHGQDFEDFTTKDEEGNLLHGFGAYDSLLFLPPVTEATCNACPDKKECDRSIEDCEYDQDDDFDGWAKELQTILPENEVFELMETGNEKLRYLVGYAVVVSKNEIKSISLSDWVDKTTNSLVGHGTRYAY